MCIRFPRHLNLAPLITFTHNILMLLAFMGCIALLDI